MRRSRGAHTVLQAPRKKLVQAVVSALISGLTPPALYALPEGGKVTAGNAGIQRTGTTLTINQATDRAAINWQSFGIAAAEAVRFNQLGASSIALNRVLGQNPTQILGSLSANGQVFILNPNGVLFGRGAQVSVGGLVASTLNLSDADFLAGRYTFGKGAAPGSVINQGTITAANGGYVALIGPQVANEGTISARLGTVALAAGEQITLNLNGNSLVSIAVDRGALDALASNRQLIMADGGQVLLLSAKAADALTRSVVNNTGILQANTLTSSDGVIRLEGGTITNSGTISATGGGKIVLRAEGDITLDPSSAIVASGARGGDVTVQANAGTLLADGHIEVVGTESAGGSIKLLGERVGLVNQASVNASGRTGGGTILVGGDYRGSNPAVQNASRTYVGPDATIGADAAEAGDGGRVIVWSDDVTRFFGHVSAKGGSGSGGGGFVEISGKGYLDFTGSVDLSAPNGDVGTLLLDPTNIEVISGGAATLALVNQFADANLGACTNLGALCSEIAPATINAAAANVTLQATNSILFTNAVSMANAGVGLTATAQTGNITVNAPITTASRATSGTTGAVSLTAGGVIAINANVTTGNASVADAGGGQTPRSGNITLSAGTSVTGTGRLITGNATITGANVAGADVATSGNISVAAGTGGVSGGIGLNGAGNALTVGTATRTGAIADTATGGNIALSSRDEINNGTLSTALGATPGTASGATTNNAGRVSATTTTAGGNVFLTAAGALRFGASTVAGNLAATSTGTITQAAAVAVTGTSSFDAGANAITLITATNNFTGAVSLNNSGANNVAVRDANALVLGTSSVGSGTLAITAAGAITQTGAITQAGAGGVSITAGAANNITLSNAGNDFVGAVRILSGNNVTLADTNAFAFGNGGTSVISGNLSLTTGGAVTQVNALTVAGTSGIDAGANAITLTNAANNFTGAVSLNNSGANNVAVRDANAIVLGASSVGSGTLTVTAAGTITQTGPTTQAAGAGAATFIAGGAAITLTNAGNDFTGAVILNNTGANNVSITDANSLILATESFGGSLTVQSNGALTQTGALTVTGTTNVNAGAGSVTLTNAANNFTGAVSLNNSGANDVAVRDANALVLSTSSVGSGALTVTAGGAITQSGPVTQAASAGAASFTTGAAAITLTNAGNDFTGAVSASNTGANAIQLTDTNAIQLGIITTVNNLTVNAVGIAQDAGGLTVAGASTFNAGAGAITLATVTNNFTGAVSLNNSGANDVAVTDTNAIILGASTVGGNLTLTAAGAVTDSGNLTVTGTASLTAGPANNITLDNANDFIGAVSVVSGNNVTLNDANALDLGALTIGGNLSVTAGGTVTQTAAASVGGTTSLTTNVGGADVLFNDAANSLSGNVAISTTGAGSDADIRATGDLAFAASSVGGSFTGVATGNVTLNGSLGAGAAGDAIVLVAGGNFINTGGAFGLTPGTGRWLVYSTNPAGDTRGASLLTAHDFKQYNTAFGGSILGTGDGFIYTLAPPITPGLGGTATRTYDGTTSAPIGSLTVSPSGAIDTDTVTLAGPTTATYDNKNVGTLKQVTASGISIASADNAGKPVYGYQLASTSAVANVGDITALAITGNVTAADKVYDATPAATLTGRALTGVIAGDTVSYTGGSATFSDKNVGAGKTVTATGLALAGADAGNYTVNTTATTSADITALALNIIADDKTRPVSTANPPFTATYSGFAGADGPVDLTGILAFSTPAIITSPPGAYAIVPSGQSATNYAITYVNGSLTITGTAGTPPGGDGGILGGTSGAASTYQDVLAASQQQGRTTADARAGIDAGRAPDAINPSQRVYEVENTGILLPAGLQR